MGSLAFSAKHLPERAASKTAGGRAKNSYRVRLGVHAPTSQNEEPSLNTPNIQQKAQKGHTFGPGLTETQSKAFSRPRAIPLFLCRATSKYFSLAGHAISVSTTQLCRCSVTTTQSMMRLCSQGLYLQNQAIGQRRPTGHSLPVPALDPLSQS